MNVFNWGIGVVVILGIVYFIPVIVASFREHPNQTAIFLLNIFLGWTLLGWVAALVWAASSFAKPLESDAITPSEPASAPEQNDQMRCPECRELIRYDAKKCRWCGSKIDIPEKWRQPDNA